MFSYEELVKVLELAFKGSKEEPVLLNSNVKGIGIVGKWKGREGVLEEYHKAVLEVLGKRTVLIPTFNLDYLVDGKYDRQSSRSHAGALSEYLRTHYTNSRTRTPVYNFCIINNKRFNLLESVDPFGEGSICDTLLQENGLIVWLGSHLKDDIFYRYLESMCRVGYRYSKPFKGEIIDNNQVTETELLYPVCPNKTPEGEPWSPLYDWDNIINDLREEGIIKEIPLGHGKVRVCRAKELYDFWSQALKEDELYFFMPSTQKVLYDLYAKHGYPLTLEKVEGLAEVVTS